MKKSLAFLFGFAFTISAFAQVSKDSLAILQLLEKESRTWRSGDLQGHSDSWLERPYNKVWVHRGEGNTLDIPASFILNPSKENFGKGGLAFLSNIKMNIYKDQAWVSHDEVSVDPEGIESYTHEMRFLEKESDQWKMIGQSLYPYQPKEALRDTTSYINTVNIETLEIENVLTINKHFEAPNWHPDQYLILNAYGRLQKLDLNSRALSVIPTGKVVSLNNDHGLSPDKKTLALSNTEKSGSGLSDMISSIYLVPVEGGEPKKVSTENLCFWHGWSPDGKTLAYVGMKGTNLDVYTIPVNGGKAKRLTKTEGLDDGPEYAPDGKYIYINSYRSGHMQIWRMRADGSRPEQLTFDENSNWFPHVSPDNKWIAYIAYVSDQKQNHFFGKRVKLRLMNLETKEIKDLTPVFYGGQGTFNVPSWSPDSKKVAFVSYSIKSKL